MSRARVRRRESRPLHSLLAELRGWTVLALLAGIAWSQEVSLHEPTREDVQRLEGEVRDDPSLTDAQRASLAETFGQALASLDAAERWRSERNRVQAERESAPQALEALRAELEASPAPTQVRAERSATLADVESSLEVARSSLEALRVEGERLAAEQQRWATLRTELPASISAAKQSLQQVEAELSVALPEDADQATAAARLVAQARAAELGAQIAFLEEELRSHEVLSSVLSARRRAQERRIAEAQALAEAWRVEAEALRQRETQRAQREAEASARRVAQVPEELRGEAERNAELARKVGQLTGRREELGRLRVETSRVLQELRESQEAAIRREDVAGLSDAIGALLRRERSRIPAVREYQRRVSSRRDEMAGVRLGAIQYEEELEGLANPAQAAAALLADLEPAVVAADLQATALELLEARRRYLEALIVDCDDVFVALAALEQDERELIATAESLQRFIDERVLWIRSSPPIWQSDFSSTPQLGVWLASVENWIGALRTVVEDAAQHPVLTFFGLVLITVLLAVRGRMRRILEASAEVARRRSCMTMAPTWKALGATTVLAVGYPFVLWAIGWRLSASLAAPDFAKALGIALKSAALVVLVAEGFRNASRPGGLGEAHFGWSEGLGRQVRLPLLVLLASAVPTLGLAMLIEAQDNEVWKYGLGRILLAAALLIFARFLYGQLKLHRRSDHRDGWRARLWGLTELASLALPGGLAALALGGYYFTAVQLLDRLVLSAALVLAALLLHAVADRALLVARRKLAVAQARKLRAARAAADEGGEGESGVEEAQALDLARVDAQSRQTLTVFVGIAIAAGAWLIWADVLPALHFLDRVELWTYSEPATDGGVGTRQVPVTLGGLLLALAIVAGALIVNRNLPGVLEITVLQRLPMGPGERYAVKAVLRYIVTLIGIVWAFGAIGIGWAKVQWLAAAISVGLGFGLQEIFANFVSGLIILGERPVRVGDWVTVGDITGKVARIHMRATTLTDRDYREWLIPNREFITGHLSNWTLSDQMTRVVVPVGIAYGSDTERAARILIEIARDTEHVVTSPAPSVVFMGFGDNSLNLELRFFIVGRDIYPAILDPVNTQIHKRLAAAGIEIAFPQRDLHIRSAPGLKDLVATAKEGQQRPAGPPPEPS